MSCILMIPVYTIKHMGVVDNLKNMHANYHIISNGKHCFDRKYGS